MYSTLRGIAQDDTQPHRYRNDVADAIPVYGDRPEVDRNGVERHLNDEKGEHY
jgi:hypothetical protein